MSKKRKYTSHAKIRIDERGTKDVMCLNNKHLLKYAAKNGRSVDAIINVVKNSKMKLKSPFIGYLRSVAHRNSRCTVILYLGYVFIFNANKTILITLYPLAEKYKEDYEAIMNKLKPKKKKVKKIVEGIQDNNKSSD